MAPKQTNNSANVPSDEKASVWLADALRLTGDEITVGPPHIQFSTCLTNHLLSSSTLLLLRQLGDRR